MNSYIRGSSSPDEPTIHCSLRHRETPVRRTPAWLEFLVILVLVVIGGWMLNKAFLAEDHREDLREQEHAEMAAGQR